MTQEKQETGYRRWFWNVWTDGRKSMNKYDMMIACNRKTSEEKINRAVTESGQGYPEDSFTRTKPSEKKWTGY